MSLLKLWLLLLSTLLGCQDRAVSAVETPCRKNMLYPAEDPYSYYFCINGDLQPETCPKGSYFDAHFLVCRHGNPSSLQEDAETTTGVCQRWGLAADLSDCSRYYHCAAKGDVVLVGKCPQDYYFDLTKLNCVVGKC